MRSKKYTVGLWMELLKSSGLQIWSIQAGTVKEPKFKWHTVVLAKDENEALQLGQAEYASKDNLEDTEQIAA